MRSWVYGLYCKHGKEKDDNILSENDKNNWAKAIGNSKNDSAGKRKRDNDDSGNDAAPRSDSSLVHQLGKGGTTINHNGNNGSKDNSATLGNTIILNNNKFQIWLFAKYD